MKSISYAILDEINETLKQLDERPLFQLAEELIDAKRIFLVGTGRCGLVMRSFAMRLMHLSLQCHVVGNVTTPAIAHGDLLVVCTLNPENRWLLDLAKCAYRVSSPVALFSPQASSPIGDLSAFKITVPKASVSLPFSQPQGVVFEQCCAVLTDSLILHLAGRLNRCNEALLKNRANLE